MFLLLRLVDCQWTGSWVGPLSKLRAEGAGACRAWTRLRIDRQCCRLLGCSDSRKLTIDAKWPKGSSFSDTQTTRRPGGGIQLLQSTLAEQIQITKSRHEITIHFSSLKRSCQELGASETTPCIRPRHEDMERRNMTRRIRKAKKSRWRWYRASLRGFRRSLQDRRIQNSDCSSFERGQIDALRSLIAWHDHIQE